MPAPERHLAHDDVLRIVAEQCCMPGRTDQVGVELEWLTCQLHDRASRPSFAPVQAAATAAPRPGGSRLTFEPGGQVELSSPPAPGLSGLAGAHHDATHLAAALETAGVGLVGLGLDPNGSGPRVVDEPRYRAMEAHFDATGPAGRTMMRATAGLQVNIDLGPPDAAERRWRRAHDLGPLLAAAFANSPFRNGSPSGWRSTRFTVWSALERGRTEPAIGYGPTTADAWTAYALAARVMLVRAGDNRYVPVVRPLTFAGWMAGGHELGWPTEDDLAYHLTTLFPPVRPRRWLELRMLDALPDPWWQAATAVAAAVIVDDEAGEQALAATPPSARSWQDAARHGLAHPDLAAAARVAFAAATPALSRMSATSRTESAVAAFVERYVERGRCPADDLLDQFAETGSLAPEPDRYSELRWATT